MAFNVVILLAGTFTLFVIQFIAALLARFGADVIQPDGVASFVIVYMLAVNVCYTLGWVTELLWSDGDTARTEDASSGGVSLGPDVFGGDHPAAGSFRSTVLVHAGSSVSSVARLTNAAGMIAPATLVTASCSPAFRVNPQSCRGLRRRRGP